MSRVAVVGGGCAGLAAACALAESGREVTLFERRAYLGGRASSYQHPGTGEVVDNCQHVLLGCCTNLLDFYRRIGAQDKICWFDALTFIEPGGRRSVLRPTPLPAPLHSTPAFLAARHLDWRDKLGIARALNALAQGVPPDKGHFLAWLKRHGQTPRAIERFWAPVLVSALNEDLDRVAVPYAAQVFRESFLKSAEAGRMGVPAVPLSDLYDAAAGYIEARGGRVVRRASVEKLRLDAGRVCVRSAGGDVDSEDSFDGVVLAVPFEGLARLLPDDVAARELTALVAQHQHSPITGVHLWFDREITELPHAVLLDRTIQWMFHKSRLLGRAGQGSYVELVVSASKSLVTAEKNAVVEMAVRELAEFFPEVARARLLKSTVIKEVRATFSVFPGVDALRPQARTAWPRIFLAGDWTATGWPATMEGAVRSGYLAAEAVTGEKVLVADLPARGLAKWMVR